MLNTGICPGCAGEGVVGKRKKEGEKKKREAKGEKTKSRKSNTKIKMEDTGLQLVIGKDYKVYLEFISTSNKAHLYKKPPLA